MSSLSSYSSFEGFCFVTAWCLFLYLTLNMSGHLEASRVVVFCVLVHCVACADMCCVFACVLDLCVAMEAPPAPLRAPCAQAGCCVFVSVHACLFLLCVLCVGAEVLLTLEVENVAGVMYTTDVCMCCGFVFVLVFVWPKRLILLILLILLICLLIWCLRSCNKLQQFRQLVCCGLFVVCVMQILPTLEVESVACAM